MTTKTDVQALAFAAGERLFFYGADDDVAPFGEAEFDEAAVHAPLAVVVAEMRRADRGGVGEVFLDGEVVVERVVLRDVGDEAFEFVEVFVKLLAVEKHLAARGGEAARDGAEQCAFSRTAAAHHAHEVAARERKTDAVERGDVAAEVAGEVAQFERGDDVALLFDDAFAEVAAQPLAGINADEVAIIQIARAADGNDFFADDDGAIRSGDFEFADLVVVIAEHAQQHIAGGAG